MGNHSPIVFAVGCFHFGLKKIYPSGMSGSDYVKELHSALGSISNINNIEIETLEKFEDLKIEPKDNLTSMSAGESFFPSPSLFLKIYFDLYIPERLQNELDDGASIDIGTEKFRVYIKDSYHFPVTFIELVEAKTDNLPSTAVMVIRKFLERHFAEKNFEFIQFDCLGPSPFHADFYISENSNVEANNYDSNGFCVEHLPQRGYDTFNFYYPKSVFLSSEEAKEALFLELSSELGLFYRMVHQNLLQSNEWDDLKEGMNSLLENNKKTGIKGAWSKAFGLYKQVQDLIISLSEFESGRVWTSFFIKTGYQHLIHSGKTTYLKDFLDDELDEFPDYPTKQIRDIIDLLESRRSKTVDNAIVVLAAVIGGIIGAVVTLLITAP